MAKSLRNKLAHMALCCTVATGMVAQAAPVLAETTTVQETEMVIGQETEVTTGSGLTVEQGETENTEKTESGQAAGVEVEETGEDTWNEVVNSAEYTGEISILKIDSEADSMAHVFFEKDEVPIEIRDGKVYLTLKISKDGLGVKDAITSLAQKQDGAYTNLELEGLTDEAVRYVTTEIYVGDVNKINKETVLKCGIDIGFTQMVQELRVVLTDETVSMLEAAFDKEEEAVIEDGTYLVDLNIWHAANDEPSHSANSFVQEDVKLTVEDGRGYLSVAVKRDMGNMKDVIGGLAQKINGVYEPLELIYTEKGEERVVVAEFELDDLEGLTYLQMDVQTPVFIHTAEVRIGLTEESLDALKQGQSEEVTSVEIMVEHTGVTAGEADGSITVAAAGGSGNFEYTIDGGTTWTNESVFTGLAAGEYKVAVRDTNNKMNVSSREEIKLSAEEEGTIADGSYLVDIEVWHAANDEPSHSAGSFVQEDIKLTVKDGKGYLSVAVKRDMGNMKDVIGGLAQKVNDAYEPLSLIYTEKGGERIVVAELELADLGGLTYLQMDVQTPVFIHTAEVRIGLTAESLSSLKQGKGEEVTSVEVKVSKKDVTEGQTDGSITIAAAGGSGNFEYTIDGGATWTSEPSFTNLSAGTYKAAARDAENTSHVSAIEEVTLVQKESNSSSGSLTNGSYSVNIEVLQESSDDESMAAQFFNKEDLPLRISNGKAYLTIQVLKDGMGMKDVITSLEQKVNGSFTSLGLNYLNDSSKRYITAEVVFDSVDSEAYLRCGIAPMGSMKPVLRIKLDESSIQAGSGNINSGLKPETSTSISSVTAENGKVTVTLAEADETLTADDFAGKIYVDGTGKALTLKDFKMEDTTVSFTFDKVEQKEANQTVQVGITFNDLETKSDEFTVKGSAAISEPVKEIGLKEDAKEIKYIIGYEDGTFRANNQVTKAETVAMLADLINAPAVNYYSAKIDVLQSGKDEASMAKQFFKTEGIQIREQAGKYFVELEIANEGLGFTNIITGVEQQVNGSFKTVEVRKSSDLKKAYVTLEVAGLSDDIILKTGIAPMGSVAPELRIVIDESSLTASAYETAFEDVDMWAKEDILLFESLGLIGGEGSTAFNPNQAITRGECIKLITLVAGLEVNADNEHPFADAKGHSYEAYIAAAYEAGLIKGYEDGSFRADQTLSRAEAVAMINRFIGHDGSTHVEMENPFSDLKTSHWAYNEILKVVQA